MPVAPGAQLRQLRLAIGLSQSRLAVSAGLSPAAVQAIEQGRRVPTLGTIEKLAPALGCEVADLITEGAVEHLLQERRRQELEAGAADILKRANAQPVTAEQAAHVARIVHGNSQ